MKVKQIAAIVIVLAVIVLADTCAYTVDQRQQALILQFGNPERVVDDPGLHFKRPWESLIRFDKRLLVQDAPPNEVITEDKKSILVDAYTRWRIADPLKVYQVASNQLGVSSRMEDIIRGKIREVLGQHTLSQIVSGGKDSNLRAALMLSIRNKAESSARELGVDIVDVRIKRADLPKENSNAVFERMKAERNRIAKQYRSEGDEAAKEIRAEADKKRTVLLADANMQARIIHGRADAQATKIFAAAYTKDPEFYAFLRSLQAYKASMGPDTTLVISPDSEFFRYFNKSTAK